MQSLEFLYNEHILLLTVEKTKNNKIYAGKGQFSKLSILMELDN